MPSLSPHHPRCQFRLGAQRQAERVPWESRARPTWHLINCHRRLPTPHLNTHQHHPTRVPKSTPHYACTLTPSLMLYVSHTTRRPRFPSPLFSSANGAKRCYREQAPFPLICWFYSWWFTVAWRSVIELYFGGGKGGVIRPSLPLPSRLCAGSSAGSVNRVRVGIRVAHHRLGSGPW